jgi:hypothetical protein
MTLTCTDCLQLYATARQFVSEKFPEECRWQASGTPATFTESDFLREAAWVILCSGFKESVVRRIFGYISLCFCDWESAGEILRCRELCRATALSIFGNEKKIQAIIDVAEYVNHKGIEWLKAAVAADPIPVLRALPFIGPVTSFHFAKNLGFETAKPDRHLVRLAQQFGFPDVHTFCALLSQASGDPVRVVDVVLWRYAEQEFPTTPL